MTHVDWHPYPDPEDIPCGCAYYVTAKKRDGSRFSTLGIYDSDLDFWTDKFEYRLDVIAWAEVTDLPEPYEPDDNHPDAITARKYMSGDPETVKALSIFDE